jgi:hypothetical protein
MGRLNTPARPRSHARPTPPRVAREGLPRADRRDPLVRGTGSRGGTVPAELAAGGSADKAETTVVLFT